MKLSLTLATLAMAIAIGIGFSYAGEAGSSSAKVGDKAPAFTLTDQDGKKVSLADFKGKVVVIEWFNNECPFVVKFYKNGEMNKWATAYAEKDVVWLAINSTKGKTDADNKAISTDWNIARPVLNDADGATGHAYGATNTPHMFVVDPNGVLAYVGAIDSKPSTDAEDIAGATNYVAAAVDELLAGSNVSNAETKAYGCSVKYAH